MSVASYDILSEPGYASASIIHKDFICIYKFNNRKTSANKWSTMAGPFLTLCEAEVEIKLPELNSTACITKPFHITDQKTITMKFLAEIYLEN